MTQIGAPGSGVSRRDFVKPTASMGPGELAVGGGFVAALLSPLAFAAFLFARGRDEGATAPETPGRPQP